MEKDQSRPGWDDCDKLPPLDRVAIKEEAIGTAQHFFKQLRIKFQDAVDRAEARDAKISESMQEFREWLTEEELLFQSHRDHRILAGVAGRSGAGKTSAINAWLGVRDLLPSSCSQAATAVVCLVSWNYDERPGHEFLAEIDFQSPQEIREEVDQFYNDVRELDDDQLDAESLADAKARVAAFFEKFKGVWGFSLSELKEMDADKLMASKPQIQQLLGTTKDIHDATADGLSTKVRPFLDSTEHKHGGSDKFAAWPLVRWVRVFLRVDILRNGLTLVDLPGLGDLNGSRAQVAKNFYPQLAVTVIVSQIHRAADEKTAHDLLDGYHEVRLQLDGKFHQKGLGFVLTHTDVIDVPSFLKNFREDPAMAKAIAANRECCILEQETHRLKKDETAEEKTSRKLGREAKQIQTQLKKLQKRLRKADESEKDAIEREMAELEMEKSQAENEYNAQTTRTHKISKLKGKKIKEQDRKYSEVVFECIRIRNIHVRNRIQHDVAQRQLQLSPDEEPTRIGVIPTSSSAYWSIKDGKEKPGFVSEKTTGVPSVQHWLKEATLCQREEHLNAILHRYSSLLHRVHQWSDVSGEDVGLTFTKQDVAECLSHVHERFTQNFSLDLADFPEKLDQINPLRRKTEFINKCKKKASQIISDWPLRCPNNHTSSARMPWNTYAAILRRGGENYTSSAGIEYKWLDQLALPAFEDMLLGWKSEFHQKVPALRDEIVERFEVNWNDYMEGITYNLGQLSLRLNPLLDRRRSALAATKKTMRDQLSDAVLGISNRASFAHPQLRESLANSLTPIFIEALAITGRHCHQARLSLVQEKCVPRSQPMFALAFEAIEKKLSDSKKRASREMNRIPVRARRHVIADLDRMLQQSMPTSADDTESRRHEIEFQKLVHHISTLWQTEWSKPIVESTEPQADFSIPETFDREIIDLATESDTASESTLDDDEDEDEDEIMEDVETKQVDEASRKRKRDVEEKE